MLKLPDRAAPTLIGEVALRPLTTGALLLAATVTVVRITAAGKSLLSFASTFRYTVPAVALRLAQPLKDLAPVGCSAV